MIYGRNDVHAVANLFGARYHRNALPACYRLVGAKQVVEFAGRCDGPNGRDGVVDGSRKDKHAVTNAVEGVRVDRAVDVFGSGKASKRSLGQSN